MELPGGCSCSEFKLGPKDRNLKKSWKVTYTFYDPVRGKKRIQIKGMNRLKTVKERLQEANLIIKGEIESLQEGSNPFDDIAIKGIKGIKGEITPNTGFIQALWAAVEKIRCSHDHKIALRSVVRGVERSANDLGITNKPIKNVDFTDYYNIFAQCHKNNPKFTGSTQIRYRKSISRFYTELQMMKAVVGNPVMLVKRERAVKKARVMPNDEHRKAINSLRETNYYLWRQIQIYFSSGARESELQRLRKEDMNLTTQEARYDILKGDHIVTDFIRPIPNAALQLWKEVYNEANDGDFLFSRKRKPGPNPVRRDQFGKAWKRHVKGTAKSRRKENSRSKNFKIEKINVPIDLQTLRHLFATEMMDKLDREYNGSKDVGKGLGHVNGKLVEMVYDKENKNRKDAKIKRKAGLF